MDRKYFDLINILISEDDWITAKQLSIKGNISERSVKNYISGINQIEKHLIMSSRKGYIINKERAKLQLSKTKREFPETPEERVKYIIMDLLTIDSSERGIDLYEISEKMFVSYETVKKDIVRVKNKLKKYDLYVNSIKSKIFIDVGAYK